MAGLIENPDIAAGEIDAFPHMRSTSLYHGMT